MNDKIVQLKKGKWADKYLCKLALLDHLRECLEKDNYLKATDSAKDSVAYQNLDKELMDLKIILDLYFEGNEDLYKQRIDKFIEKMDFKIYDKIFIELKHWQERFRDLS